MYKWVFFWASKITDTVFDTLKLHWKVNWKKIRIWDWAHAPSSTISLLFEY